MLGTGHAALKSAKVSDYKGDVTISSNGSGVKPAEINSTVTPSDVVRTGTKSLAELVFNDNTLTRLGANTIFSYSPKNREFEVQSGTALLQVPPGLGGAKIQTAAVTAAITGTTVMVQKLPSGVVKLLVLEGSMNATLKGSNQMQTIKAGQMLVIPPNIRTLPQPVVVNVATIMGTSKLITGFKTLSSDEKIAETEERQEELTGNGGMKTGGVVITTTEDLLRLIGNNVLTSATFDSLTLALDKEQGFYDGPVTIGSGAVLRPTAGNVLGQLTLNNGMIIPAMTPHNPGDTLFQLTGPLTFTGTLPLIDPSSSNELQIFVLGTGLSPQSPAISFINSSDGPGGDFNYRSLLAAAGAINFNNADFGVNNTFFEAAGGDINISSGSTLTVDNGTVLFNAAGNVNIDSSGVEVTDLSSGSIASIYSGGTMTVNNSTIGGPTGIGNSINLSSQGNINIVSSLIGGANQSAVAIYAHAGSNLAISSSTISATNILLAGNVVALSNVVLTGTTLNIYRNTFTNTGSTFNGNFIDPMYGATGVTFSGYTP